MTASLKVHQCYRVVHLCLPTDIQLHNAQGQGPLPNSWTSVQLVRVSPEQQDAAFEVVHVGQMWPPSPNVGSHQDAMVADRLAPHAWIPAQPYRMQNDGPHSLSYTSMSSSCSSLLGEHQIPGSSIIDDEIMYPSDGNRNDISEDGDVYRARYATESAYRFHDYNEYVVTLFPLLWADTSFIVRQQSPGLFMLPYDDGHSAILHDDHQQFAIHQESTYPDGSLANAVDTTRRLPYTSTILTMSPLSRDRDVATYISYPDIQVYSMSIGDGTPDVDESYLSRDQSSGREVETEVRHQLDSHIPQTWLNDSSAFGDCLSRVQ